MFVTARYYARRDEIRWARYTRATAVTFLVGFISLLSGEANPARLAVFWVGMLAATTTTTTPARTRRSTSPEEPPSRPTVRRTSTADARDARSHTMKRTTPPPATTDTPSVSFRTTLLGAGKTAVGFEIPDELVEQLGHGRRPPVIVTIRGHSYPSTVAVMGGKYMIGVSAENRQPAGVGAGDTVDIRLDLDTSARTVVVPADLQRALANVPAAKRRFEALSNAKQKLYVGPIEQAKTPETRQRRIDKAIDELSQDD